MNPPNPQRSRSCGPQHRIGGKAIAGHNSPRRRNYLKARAKQRRIVQEARRRIRHDIADRLATLYPDFYPSH